MLYIHTIYAYTRADQEHDQWDPRRRQPWPNKESTTCHGKAATASMQILFFAEA